MLDPKHKIKDLSFEEIKPMGFIKPEVKEEDYWFLGGKLPTEEINPSGQWLDYLVEKEYQKKNGVETMGCTGFGTLNAFEILHKFLYPELPELNLSDRCINILAENTKNGNSPQKPVEALRQIGCCLEKTLPFDESINTWEKFHSPKPLPQIPYLAECNKFIEDYEVGHEWINAKNKNELIYALKRSPVGISVLAWKFRNGLYYKNNGEMDNHWCVLVGFEYGVKWYVFDTYDNFVKELEWDYDFGFAKRYYLRKKVVEKPNTNYTNDMLKTVKFTTDNRIYIQDPVNTKNIIWISDKDGTSELDWQFMKKYNLITPVPEEINPALKPQYNEVKWTISADMEDDVNLNPFSAIIQKIVGWLKGK